MDERQLLTSKTQLGAYEVAALIYSFGDVLEFLDGEQKGVIIADTCGHYKPYGDRMREFLQKEIRNDWPGTRRAKDAMFNLGDRLSMEIYGEAPWPKDRFKADRVLDNWWGFNEFQYVSLGDTLEIVGIHSDIVRANGTVEKRPENVGILGPYHSTGRKMDVAPYTTTLGENDVLLFTSDGFVTNTCHSRNMEWRAVLSTVFERIAANTSASAVHIRDELIREYGQDFLPNPKKPWPEYIEHDDVTLVVIKKTIKSEQP